MKAIIPVAGIGTRLRPLTNTTPKVLINVAGKPILSYLIDELMKIKEIDSIILVIGHLGNKIKDYVEKTYSSVHGKKFEFAEQKEMNGLGHAVYQAKQFVNNGSIFIVLGDTIYELDFEGFLSSEHSTIGIKDVEDITRYGIVEIKDGFITRMMEKPSGSEVTSSKSAIAGLYLIKDSVKLFSSIEFIIKNNIRTKNEYQITDAFQNMLDGGEKFIPFHIKNWFDCGTPEALMNTNAYILKRDYSSNSQFSFPNTKIIPPVYIGSNCTIENSTLGPCTTVADGAKITNSKVMNSLICEDAVVKDSNLREVLIGEMGKVKGEYEKIIIADSTELKF